MGIKKWFSTLTAGVMATTTLFTSALVTPMMSFLTHAADGDVAYFRVCDSYYAINTYDETFNNSTTINGDGQYSLSVTNNASYSSADTYELYGGDSGYPGLSIVLFEPQNVCSYTTENFTIDSLTFGDRVVEDVSFNISEGEFSRKSSEDNADGEHLYSTVIRIDPTNLTGYTVAPGESLTVNFTIGTSETPADETTTTMTTTTEPEETTTTTSTSSVGRDVSIDFTVEEKDGTDGAYNAVEFDPAGADSVTVKYNVTSNDLNTSYAFGTYDKDAEEWKQVDMSEVDVPAGGACTAEYDVPS